MADYLATHLPQAAPASSGRLIDFLLGLNLDVGYSWETIRPLLQAGVAAGRIPADRAEKQRQNWIGQLQARQFPAKATIFRPVWADCLHDPAFLRSASSLGELSQTFDDYLRHHGQTAYHRLIIAHLTTELPNISPAIASALIGYLMACLPADEYWQTVKPLADTLAARGGLIAATSEKQRQFLLDHYKKAADSARHNDDEEAAAQHLAKIRLLDPQHPLIIRVAQEHKLLPLLRRWEGNGAQPAKLRQRILDLSDAEVAKSLRRIPQQMQLRLLRRVVLVLGIVVGLLWGGLAIRGAYQQRLERQEEESRQFLQRLKAEMVLVKGGCFMMGSKKGEKDEQPIHKVCLADFFLGTDEVTQAEWEAVMGRNPSSHAACPKCPVEQVSWDDIQEFLGKLNAKTGRKYRLPTEAEWEYAARGGSLSRGYSYSGSNNLDAVAWYSANSGNGTHPGGEKQPNELGLYDMSGNVWEWVNDWDDGTYYANSPSNDPQGPSTGSARVFRGGGWDYDAAYCRSAFRYYNSPGARGGNLGFRLARSSP
jgi:formylglycine-generating enzyme required for sulfatase activity